LELRELKIIEYEKDMPEDGNGNGEHGGGKIKIESVGEKIQFITQMLERLKEIHEKEEGSPAITGGDRSPPKKKVVGKG
jgi:hypothetical protein